MAGQGGVLAREWRHDYIPKGIKVTEWLRICIKKHQRGDNSKCNIARALIFVRDYATHRHDLFYITVKYHDYIPKGIQVTEWTRICIKKHQREDNSK